MAGGGGEADLFRTARIGVLWNMDLCPISPAFSDATRIVPQIKSSLLIMGYEGEVAIGAIGDTRKLSPNILRDLRATGIIVEHSGGDEHLNYKEATAHLYAWAMHNHAPANIVCISTDGVSVKDLLILGKRGFNIIKAKPKRRGVIRNYLWKFSDIVVRRPVEENVLPMRLGFRIGRDAASAAVCSWNWDVGPSLSQCSSVEPNLLLDSGGRADNNRDGNGEFGDYKGEQARKNPNADTSSARQPQSGRKHRKSYQLLSKFICF